MIYILIIFCKLFFHKLLFNYLNKVFKFELICLSQISNKKNHKGTFKYYVIIIYGGESLNKVLLVSYVDRGGYQCIVTLHYEF